MVSIKRVERRFGGLGCLELSGCRVEVLHGTYEQSESRDGFKKRCAKRRFGGLGCLELSGCRVEVLLLQVNEEPKWAKHRYSAY